MHKAAFIAPDFELLLVETSNADSGMEKVDYVILEKRLVCKEPDSEPEEKTSQLEILDVKNWIDAVVQFDRFVKAYRERAFPETLDRIIAEEETPSGSKLQLKKHDNGKNTKYSVVLLSGGDNEEIDRFSGTIKDAIMRFNGNRIALEYETMG